MKEITVVFMFCCGFLGILAGIAMTAFQGAPWFILGMVACVSATLLAMEWEV